MGQAQTRALRKRYGHAVGDIVYEQSGGWWVASLPGVSGAYSQGRTRRAAHDNLLDALSEIDKARADGLVA
jgi:hypothetical protein